MIVSAGMTRVVSDDGGDGESNRFSLPSPSPHSPNIAILLSSVPGTSSAPSPSSSSPPSAPGTSQPTVVAQQPIAVRAQPPARGPATFGDSLAARARALGNTPRSASVSSSAPGPSSSSLSQSLSLFENSPVTSVFGPRLLSAELFRLS